jgi:Fe-S cluster biogenesis protein NfuA
MSRSSPRLGGGFTAATSSSRVFPSSSVFLQQYRSVFIQTSDTPNPESLKFIPTGVTVVDSDDSAGFYVTKQDKASEILRSPLAKSLFDVEGVKAVYLGSDFVTVTKFAEHKWKLLRPQLFEVLMDWADKGEPALLDQPLITDTTILDDDDEVVAMIKELIESRIRPAVQEDGGDIRYVSFEEETGLVTVQLAGSCVGCPSSSVTLKQGVENMLMHYIPEVKNVVALDEPEPEGDGGEASSAAAVEPEEDVAATKQKSYEERLKAAGIPFSA